MNGFLLRYIAVRVVIALCPPILDPHIMSLLFVLPARED
jgi:hypothetical protein